MPLQKERRCPRLGHEVSFAYCLTCGENQGPCWKVADCWWEYFDVVAYLKENYPADRVTALLNIRPKPKISSIIELIQQAKERTKEE